MDIPLAVPPRKGAEMLRDEEEMEDVRSQSGHLAGRTLVPFLCLPRRQRAAR